MPYLSEVEVNRRAQQALSEFRSLSKIASFSDKKTLFLAHSSEDKPQLEGVINWLQEFGGQAFIDKDDVSLRAKTTAATARRLRDHIQRLPLFVLYVTKASRQSRWVPWELGLANGLKDYTKIALLPATAIGDKEDWVENEYLGLYPRIMKGGLEGHTGDVWKVFDPSDQKSWLFTKWLQV